MARKILVLVDGSASSDKAFETALLMKSEKDTLYVVHAVSTTDALTTLALVNPTVHKEVHDALTREASDLLKKYSKKTEEQKLHNIHYQVLTSGHDNKQAVVEYASEKEVDIVIVGSRGLGKLKSFLIGSFSDYVVHHAACSVLVVRGNKDDVKAKAAEGKDLTLSLKDALATSSPPDK